MFDKNIKYENVWEMYVSTFREKFFFGKIKKKSSLKK